MGAPMSTTKPVANPVDAFLQPHDFVGISFWIISIAMIASTFFFFLEAGTVNSHWKTSLHVGGLVTLVAGVHYMYMREYWVQVHSSPIVYRYVDWNITVPLQMIEFNLILKAAGKPVSSGMFWRLLVGTLVMLECGFMGEIGVMPAGAGFAGGMAGWFYILNEIFNGEAGGSAAECSEAVATSFNTMRMIVTVGWSIYPLGYFFGYLLGDVDETPLNLVYNVADFVNKIGFVLACWACAKSDSEIGFARSTIRDLEDILERANSTNDSLELSGAALASLERDISNARQVLQTHAEKTGKKVQPLLG